jgi:hypothetical protein
MSIVPCLANLAPCPFCGCSLEVNGSIAHHPTSLCIMSKFRPLIEAYPADGGVWKSWDAERWNNRTPLVLAEVQAAP